MQFVKNGPEVPDRLLQEHEDGRVVFFCGAGISYPAGLPGFRELTERIYADLHIHPNAVQKAALQAKQFDRAIGLLEQAVVGGRHIVRQHLAKILSPNLDAPRATATHEALLTLGQDRAGRMRIVTTNFDRLFEIVIDNRGNHVRRHEAPLLPVPKSRWTGLVYLHGLLPDDPSADKLNDLVVSSGDFGRAYLTERWAARFVGDLFRNYTVCFVGYSIDDPVLRYMTDALAADRLLGESPSEMFAFAMFSKGQKETCINEWTAKNVTPILYRKYRHHWYLHRTLDAWKDTYGDGIGGKESIIARYAGLRPSESTTEDDFVGRMLWALSDPSGLPAKRFADRDPVPSLEWLELLSERIYGWDDLSRFGVSGGTEKDDTLKFSLIRRPAPYTHAPWMTLLEDGIVYQEWDDVMHQLARWLIRHLNDPKLVLWLSKHSGPVHHHLANYIELHLGKLEELEQTGNTNKLKHILDNAPHAVPRPLMRRIWYLLLTGRVKAQASDSYVGWTNIFHWRSRLERDGLNTALRLQLRDMLTPHVSFHEPFLWDHYPEASDGPRRLKDLVDWRIVLSIDDARSAIEHLRDSPRWPDVLPELMEDFDALLCDAMDLARELGGADGRSDRTYVYLPSIAEHGLNTGSPDWMVLVELARDAWRATAMISPERARHIAEMWSTGPYPVFRRLAFFAAAEGA